MQPVMTKSAFVERGKQAVSWLGKCYHSVIFSTVVIGSTLLYIAYYLGMNATKGALAFTWQKPVSLVMIVHGLVLLNTILQKKPIELRILLLNVLWMFLSRCLLGNYTFEFDDECFWAIMLCLMFASGVSLEAKRRKLLLVLVTLELVIVTGVWGAIGLLTGLNQQSLEGFEAITIKLHSFVPLDQHLEIFTYRTIVAAYYLITSGLAIYQLMHTPNWFWRSVAFFYLPLAFIALALQDCRSISVGFAILLATFMVERISLKQINNSKYIHYIILLVVWIVTSVLVYTSLAFCHEAILGERKNQPSTQVTANTPAVSIPSATTVIPSAPVSVIGNHSFSFLVGLLQSVQTNPHSRGDWWSITTFSGRTDVWEATIPTLMDNKKAAVLGQPEKTCMDAINAHIARDPNPDVPVVIISHMHNLWLEQLVIAGIPGLLLYVVLLALLIYRIVRVFTSSHNQITQSWRILGVLFVAFLLYGAMEPLLSLRIPIASLLFCVIMGVFVADTSELGIASTV